MVTNHNKNHGWHTTKTTSNQTWSSVQANTEDCRHWAFKNQTKTDQSSAKETTLFCRSKKRVTFQLKRGALKKTSWSLMKIPKAVLWWSKGKVIKLRYGHIVHHCLRGAIILYNSRQVLNILEGLSIYKHMEWYHSRLNLLWTKKRTYTIVHCQILENNLASILLWRGTFHLSSHQLNLRNGF